MGTLLHPGAPVALALTDRTASLISALSSGSLAAAGSHVCVHLRCCRAWCRPALARAPHLQGGALVREGRAEEGGHDAHHDLRDVLLQDGVRVLPVARVVAGLEDKQELSADVWACRRPFPMTTQAKQPSER